LLSGALRKFHIIAAGVEPVASRGGPTKALAAARGAFISASCCEAACKRSFAPRSITTNLPPFEETEAVGAGLQGLTGRFPSVNLVEQIGLVFLLESRGVAGAVNHSRENIEIISEVTPPLLRNWTGALWPRKKTRSGKIFGENVRGLENHLLACGGRVVGSYGMEMPEREAQKHERQENEKTS